MPTILIGLLGPTLDRGSGDRRWEHWRPTVSLFQHEDLLIDRVELLYQPKFKQLLDVVAEDIRSVSPETEVRPHAIDYRDPWDFEEVFSALHAFAADYEFDTDREEYFIHITTGTHVQQICEYLLTESRHLPGKLLQAQPPKRGKEGPGTYSVIDLDLSRYDNIAARFVQEAANDISFLKSGIETRNPAFNTLIERIEQVALRSAAPMLITGPTGAGKSLLARRVYELRRSRNLVSGAFVEANCATLRGDAAMSALFGHRKGAFTGAAADRKGLLRSADGGVLFLDEVGELGLDEQAMLLRAIEEKRFLPLGSDREEQSDFQLICGTNRDLKDDLGEGRFREDLLARIDLWTFALPGLRDRREDIEPNLDYELASFARKSGKRVTFNKEARRRFLKFALSPEAEWSGNFRDLNAALTRMATLAVGGRINEAAVEEEVARLRGSWRGASRGPGQALVRELLAERADEVDAFDRCQLEDVLQVCRRSKNLSDAGRKLFNISRTRKKQPNDADRLRKYLAKFGLEWSAITGET